MIATIKHNHPETMIKLFDLKRGGDFNCFENVDRLELQLGPEYALNTCGGIFVI